LIIELYRAAAAFLTEVVDIDERESIRKKLEKSEKVVKNEQQTDDN
jgi:hypothetical protein